MNSEPTVPELLQLAEKAGWKQTAKRRSRIYFRTASNAQAWIDVLTEEANTHFWFLWQQRNSI